MFNIEERPYSQTELKHIRTLFKKKLRLSDMKATHCKCGHFYFVKKNGRKEKAIEENKKDVGNCSVCWKLHNKPDEYISRMIDDYTEHFQTEPEFLNIALVDLEVQYYSWLYETPVSKNSKI